MARNTLEVRDVWLSAHVFSDQSWAPLALPLWLQTTGNHIEGAMRFGYSKLSQPEYRFLTARKYNLSYIK